jgi:hypothetical protein
MALRAVSVPTPARSAQILLRALRAFVVKKAVVTRGETSMGSRKR